jgi:transglutaminase 1
VLASLQNIPEFTGQHPTKNILPCVVIGCLCLQANSNDDDGGVLTGRWTDTYPADSTKPWAWTGSVKIMEEFMKTKKAVRFGQCWVFSGLVTSRKFKPKLF